MLNHYKSMKCRNVKRKNSHTYVQVSGQNLLYILDIISYPDTYNFYDYKRD